MRERIYIAAAYGRRREMHEKLAQPLVSMGHEVTSRWLWEDHSSDQSDEAMECYARDDMRDVARSTALVAMSDGEDAFLHGSRGGRHVEFGMALAAGINVHLIGPAGRTSFTTWRRCSGTAASKTSWTMCYGSIKRGTTTRPPSRWRWRTFNRHDEGELGD